MNQWINAEQEKPDADVLQLVTLRHGEQVDVATAYWDDEDGLWRYECGARCNWTVTHWMEFPEPANGSLPTAVSAERQ